MEQQTQADSKYRVFALSHGDSEWYDKHNVYKLTPG